MTGPPSAAQGRTAGTAPASTGSSPPKVTAGAAGTSAPPDVTLITGDRVVLDSRGAFAQLRPAKGRESVPVQIRVIKGHTYVLPSEAAGMIASGTLDMRLFDVTELSRPEYRELTGDGVPLLVTCAGAGLRAVARNKLRAGAGTTVRAEIGAIGAEALTVRGPGLDHPHHPRGAGPPARARHPLGPARRGTG